MATQVRYATSDWATIVGSWSYSTGATYFGCIDEVGTPNDADYVTGLTLTSSHARLMFGFSVFSIPAGSTAISVTVRVRAMNVASSACNIGAALRINGVNYDAAGRDPSDSPTITDYDDTWATNPAGGDWTVDQINNAGGTGLQYFGLHSGDLTPDVNVYQCYITVTYTYTPDPTTVNLDALTLSGSVPDIGVDAPQYQVSFDGAIIRPYRRWGSRIGPVSRGRPGTAGTTVAMNALTLAGSVPTITVTPGAVALALDVLTLAGSTPTLTLTGALSLLLDALTLAGSTPTITVTPGAVSLALNALTLAGSVPTITVTPGAVSLVMQALTLAGSVPDITVLRSTIIALDALTLAGSTPTISVTPGAVSLAMQALSLAGSTPDIVVSLGAVSLEIGRAHV